MLDENIDVNNLTEKQVEILLVELSNTPFIHAIRSFRKYHQSQTLSALATVNAFKNPDIIADYQGFYKGLGWLETNIENFIEERKQKKEESETKING